MASGRRTARRGPNWISLGFLALAIVLAGVAAFLYLREDEAEVPPPPPAEAGRNELIHVQQALESEGMTVEQVPATVRSETMTPPAQILGLDGGRLYVFVYADPTEADAAFAGVDPATILPERTRTGTPIATEMPRVYAQSNVVAALVGGDDELAGRVERAIEGLA